MVSRAVSEVIFVVGIVILAIVVAIPLGNYVMNVNRPEHFEGGRYQLEILNVRPRAFLGGVPCLAVYVKNTGKIGVPNTTIPGVYPSICALNSSLRGVFWPAAVVNSSGYFLVNVSELSYICRSGPGDELTPESTWVIYYPSLAQENNESFAAYLYGPGGARAVFYHHPP